jgi:hypothetical protein
MDYFLNIDNTPYYQWQTELLIESFKEKKCSNDLFLALTNSTNTSFLNNNFTKNIFSHNRTYSFDDIGSKKGFPELNKFICLANCITKKLIKQPFFVLEPDVVLHNNIDMLFSKNYCEFIFAIDPFFTLESAEENVGPFWEWFNLEKDNLESNWVPLGECYAFNNIPDGFFYKVIKDAEKMALHQLLNQKNIWSRTVELSLAMNLSNNITNISCRGDYKIVAPVMFSSESYFISYKDGILPSFHKSMFKYNPPNYVSFGDPIKILSENTFSPNAKYISNLAKKSISSRKK